MQQVRRPQLEHQRQSISRTHRHHWIRERHVVSYPQYLESSTHPPLISVANSQIGKVAADDLAAMQDSALTGLRTLGAVGDVFPWGTSSVPIDMRLAKASLATSLVQ